MIVFAGSDVDITVHHRRLRACFFGDVEASPDIGKAPSLVSCVCSLGF